MTGPELNENQGATGCLRGLGLKAQLGQDLIGPTDHTHFPTAKGRTRRRKGEEFPQRKFTRPRFAAPFPQLVTAPNTALPLRRPVEPIKGGCHGRVPRSFRP